jgi:hypothetical protein
MKTSRLIVGSKIVAIIFISGVMSTLPVKGVVGYVNLTVYPGDNLIANHLNNPENSAPNNTLADILASPYANIIPDGTTFTKWDSAANAYMPLSIYSSITGWSINYSLNLGEGGLLNSPSQWTNTFVGEFKSYSNITPEFGGPIWAPDYPDGLHLIGCPEPIAGSVSNMFANVVGRAPADGEWVKVLNPATQTYITATYDATLDVWDNDPNLPLGQSAWFNLGPVNVPEPSTLALVSLSFAAMFARRRS